ncbi:O-acyltransferase like protein [Rhipicephalus microplus]|uniref:O-acyltransferase like protein n=1 Tax=Rhipicephalus microplus TaxID=6941 RepID=UPI0018896925|nr:nose resistant to fluoxetine protein 6-like isoform X1 [Rhipicephalus microplus]
MKIHETMPAPRAFSYHCKRSKLRCQRAKGLEMKTRQWLTIGVMCCFLSHMPVSLAHHVEESSPNSTMLPTQQSSTANLATKIRHFAGNFAQSIPPWIKQRMLQAEVSIECSLGLLKTLRGLSNLEPWTLRMIDSSGKVPGNLFIGSVSELGSFDECLATVVRDESGRELVRAQYCSLYVRPESDSSIIDLFKPALLMTHPKAANLIKFLNDPRVPGFRLGICVVSDCSEEELQAVGTALLGDVAPVSVKYCMTGVPQELTASNIAVIAVLGVILILLVFGTLTDLYAPKQSRATVAGRLLRSFSVPANLRLLTTATKKSSESYSHRFMHGIRAVSIFHVVFGHATCEYSFASGGMAYMLSYLDRYDSPLTAAGFISVDTFFFMSGYLFFYIISGIKNVRSGKATVVIIFRRWYRLLLPVVLAACAFSLLPLFVSGPTTNMVYDKFYDDVKNHWWTVVLNVRNLYREVTYGLNAHLWYISADFQLFLVALLFYQITQRKRVIIAAFTLISIACCCFTAWQVYGTKFTPVLVMITQTFDDYLDMLTDVYMLPTYHAACYFGGCIAFYAVDHYKTKKISKAMEAALWAVSLGLGTACIFYRFEWTRGTEHGNLAKVSLAFWDRILWATALAALTFLCATGRGGVVQKILSASPLAVLSRLSFGVYLTHFPFYFLSSNAMRTKRYMGVFNWFMESMSVYAWSCMFALVLFLACEAPLGRLDKVIWGTPQTKKHDHQMNGRGDPELATHQDQVSK